MKLGERIFELRSERGMSQGALAEKLGVSRQAVSKWENNSALPELEKLTALADLFGVTLDRLATGEDLPDAAAPTREPGGFGLLLPFREDQIAGALLLAAAFWGMTKCGAESFSFRIFSNSKYGICGFLHNLWFMEQFAIMLPCLLGGVLCFCARRRTALWCGWAIYLTTVQSVINVAGDGWWELLRGERGGYHIHRYTLDMCLQLLGLLVLLAVTVWQFRRKPLRMPARLRRGLQAAAWAAAIAAPLLRLWIEDTLVVWRWLHEFTPLLAGALWQFGFCALAAALALTFARLEPSPGAETSLGGRIHALRTARRLSQGELADRLDVSRQSVSKWETGNAVPELEKLLALSRQFGVSLEQLARKGLPASPAVTLVSWGQAAGIGLLFAGLYELLPTFNWFFDGFAVDGLRPLLLLLGGLACLLCPRCAWLWCVWIKGLDFAAAGWLYTLYTASRVLLSPPQNWYSISGSLPELAVQAALLLLTVWAFRRMQLPAACRSRWRLPAGWGLWLLLDGAIWRWIYPVTFPVQTAEGAVHESFRNFAGLLSLLGLALLLTVTAAAMREFRLRRPDQTAQAAPGRILSMVRAPSDERAVPKARVLSGAYRLTECRSRKGIRGWLEAYRPAGFRRLPKPHPRPEPCLRLEPYRLLEPCF